MSKSWMVLLLSLVGCSVSATTTKPSPPIDPIEPGPALSEDEARVQLEQLHRSFVAANADGLSADECAALTEGYQRLVERDPSLSAARFNVAAVWEACGELERAETIYAELATREHPQALNNLGVLAWSRSDHARARELFERAIAADRLNALEPRCNLAMIDHARYLQSRSLVDFAAAELQLKNVLALDSRNQLAYEHLARLYYDRGRLDEPAYLMLADLVITQAQRVLDEPGNAELHNLRGLLWMQRDDPARAIRAFQRALELDADHVDARRNVAMIAIRFRDYALAQQALEAVIKAPEAASDVEVWLALGVARRGLRDFDGAEAAYRHALTLASDDPRGWFNLGVLAQDHRVADAEDGDEVIELALEAAGHFRKFTATAKHPRWRGPVAEAKDRLAIAEDTVETIEFMKTLVFHNPPVTGRTDERIERLLELELEALGIEEILAPPS